MLPNISAEHRIDFSVRQASDGVKRAASRRSQTDGDRSPPVRTRCVRRRSDTGKGQPNLQTRTAP